MTNSGNWRPGDKFSNVSDDIEWSVFDNLHPSLRRWLTEYPIDISPSNYVDLRSRGITHRQLLVAHYYQYYINDFPGIQDYTNPLGVSK